MANRSYGVDISKIRLISCDMCDFKMMYRDLPEHLTVKHGVCCNDIHYMANMMARIHFYKKREKIHEELMAMSNEMMNRIKNRRWQELNR